MTSRKKLEKSQSKTEKKAAKNHLKLQKKSPGSASSNRPSAAIRYAEIVRGCLYVLTGISLIVALILGQRGAVMSLDDVIDSLFAANAGKMLLALIGVALLIYGGKHLRLVR